jgi:hypothetical protein
MRPIVRDVQPLTAMPADSAEPVPPPIVPLPAPPLPKPPALPELRYRHETLAKSLCLGLGLGLVLLGLPLIKHYPQLSAALGAVIGTGMAAAYWFTVRSARAQGNAILISEHQWPELHQVVLDCQRRLQLQNIRAYVVQDLVLEQSGMRLGDDHRILLRASLVDAALSKGDLEILRFHIGRKCGQIALGHRHFSSTTLVQIARLVYPLYAWYRRCQERSADRAGLWASGSRQPAHQGLSVMAAGVQIGNRLSPQAIRVQNQEIIPSLLVKIISWNTERTFYPQRLLALDTDADELGLK